MNKQIGIIVIAAFLFACKGKDQQAMDIDSLDSKPLISKNTAVFNTAFERILATYNRLKNAITDYDLTAANAAATRLSAAADSLPLTEIKGDTTGAIKQTAASYTSTISSAAKTLVTSNDLEKKKRQFQSISDALFDLIRTVKYDKEKIYRQHCPMAFNDQEEAYWISESSEVVNPYLGRKHPKYKGTMINCGDIADSLDFRQH